MTFSFSSVLNASIFGLVLIGSIYLLGRNRSFLRKINPGILILLAYIIMLRLICPIEFPFTFSVYYKGFLATLQASVIKKKFFLSATKIRLTDIMFAVWFIGILAALCRYVVSYRRTKRLLELSDPVKDSYIDEIVQQINTKYGRDKQFRIVHVPGVTTPMIFGPVRPYIILPEEEMPKEECFYVLYHELVHYYKGHLYIKMMFAVLSCVYWWNPIVYVLNRFVTDFLEMEVDNIIAGDLDELKRIDYMQCLLDKSRTQIRRSVFLKDSVTFCERNTSLIARRIVLICDKSEKGSDNLFSGVVAAVFLLSFIISSALILEPETYMPDYYEPEAEESYFSFSDKGTFMIRREDGGFDLYSNYVYLYTTSDQYIIDDESMRVYETLEEALENEK